MKKNIRKISIILAIAFYGLLFSSFSRNNIKSVKGYIHVYGNDPFTYIGIKTEDKKEYAIDADKETTDQLRASQGKKIEITGRIIKSEKNEPGMLKEGKIEVIEWKVCE